MILADELRGVGIRRPIKQGGVRRIYCVDESRTAEIEREERLRRKREYAREWARKHPDRIKAIKAREREKNAARIKRYKEAWRLKNIAHVRAYQARKSREWRRAHPELARAQRTREWTKNRDERLARRRQLYAERKAAERAAKAAT